MYKTNLKKYFGVRCGKTHGKHISLPCVFQQRTTKATNKLTDLTVCEKKVCRAPPKKRTTNYLFAAR
jgi:hypothetical protein